MSTAHRFPLLTAAVLLMASLHPSSGHGQLPPFFGRDRHLLPAPAAGTVEAMIAPLFGAHASDCNLGFGAGKSPVPRRIRTALGTGNMAGPGELFGIAGGSALWYVYHDDEVRRAAPVTPQVGRLLDPEYEAAQPLLESDVRFGGVAMTRSCMGALLATVEGRSPPFPQVSLDAAARANLERKSTLTAMSGRFISPLAAVMERNDWRTRHLRLQLWELYRREPGLINGARYMHEFTGVMLQRVANLTDDHDFSANTAANLGLVTAHLQGKLARGERLDVREVATVVYSDLDKPAIRATRFRPLPLPGAIARMAFGPGAVTPLNVGDPMRPATEHTYRFRVDGVPGSVCARSWEVQALSQDFYAEGTSPDVGTQTLRAVDNNGVPGCVFALSWRPRDEVLGRPDGEARVRANIRSADAVGGAQLSIPVDQMFYANDLPRVSQRRVGFEQPSTTTTGAGLFSQHWEVELHVEDTGDPVRKEPGTTVSIAGNGKLVCAGSREVPVTARIEADARRVFHLYIETDAGLREEDYESALNDNCAYTATVQLPMSPAPRRVARTLVARVMVRRPKATQTAPAPGQEGGVD